MMDGSFPVLLRCYCIQTVNMTSDIVFFLRFCISMRHSVAVVKSLLGIYVFLTHFSREKKSKLIWIDNKEKDTNVRQFFFPLYNTKTAYC
jgi:hypothetical protein